MDVGLITYLNLGMSVSITYIILRIFYSYICIYFFLPCVLSFYSFSYSSHWSSSSLLSLSFPSYFSSYFSLSNISTINQTSI